MNSISLENCNIPKCTLESSLCFPYTTTFHTATAQEHTLIHNVTHTSDTSRIFKGITVGRPRYSYNAWTNFAIAVQVFIVTVLKRKWTCIPYRFVNRDTSQNARRPCWREQRVDLPHLRPRNLRQALKLPCATLFKPICNDKYAVRQKLIQTNFLLSLNLPPLPFLLSPLPWNVPNTPRHPDIFVWHMEVFLFRQPAYQIILTVSISSSTSTHWPCTSVVLAIW